MGNLESNLNNLSETFDKLNQIRESSLTISRSIVRDCSKSIRYLHRNDTEGAKEFIKNAEKKIKELKKLCLKNKLVAHISQTTKHGESSIGKFFVISIITNFGSIYL